MVPIPLLTATSPALFPHTALPCSFHASTLSYLPAFPLSLSPLPPKRVTFKALPSLSVRRLGLKCYRKIYSYVSLACQPHKAIFLTLCSLKPFILLPRFFIHCNSDWIITNFFQRFNSGWWCLSDVCFFHSLLMVRNHQKVYLCDSLIFLFFHFIYFIFFLLFFYSSLYSVQFFINPFQVSCVYLYLFASHSNMWKACVPYRCLEQQLVAAVSARKAGREVRRHGGRTRGIIR